MKLGEYPSQSIICLVDWEKSVNFLFFCVLQKSGPSGVSFKTAVLMFIERTVMVFSAVPCKEKTLTDLISWYTGFLLWYDLE